MTVMSSFAFDPAIADDANPAKSADNGRGVFFQLESNAMGGNTTFTASFYMRQLFDMKPNNLPVKQRVALHNETCHRLLQCPTLSIDSLLKAHLLYILGADPNYVVVCMRLLRRPQLTSMLTT